MAIDAKAWPLISYPATATSVADRRMVTGVIWQVKSNRDDKIPRLCRRRGKAVFALGAIEESIFFRP
jgi:hypothetical protein